MGKCRNEVNMPEWNYNIHVCNLQVNFIATNSKYEYKVSFSHEMSLDLINHSLKHVHAVIFMYSPAYQLFSGVYPIS